MTNPHVIRCPHCMRFNNLASEVRKKGEGPPEEARPKTGDIGVCIACSGVFIFDVMRMHGARKPTPNELLDVEASPESLAIIDALRKANQSRHGGRA